MKEKEFSIPIIPIIILILIIVAIKFFPKINVTAVNKEDCNMSNEVEEQENIVNEPTIEAQEEKYSKRR